MRNDGADARSFWTVGGDIVAAGRPLCADDAFRLARFYAAAPEDARRSGDGQAAAYLAPQADQLSAAMHAADRWRRAANASRSPMFSNS